jgi:hypothetical protein
MEKTLALDTGDRPGGKLYMRRSIKLSRNAGKIPHLGDAVPAQLEETWVYISKQIRAQGGVEWS